MKKIIVLEHLSLDGVIQAPGGKEEDLSGDFMYGGMDGAVLEPRAWYLDSNANAQ